MNKFITYLKSKQMMESFIESLRRDDNKSTIDAILEGFSALTESVTSDISYLFKYLKADPATILPHDYPFLLDEWLEYNDINLPQEINSFEDYEKVEWLVNNDPVTYKKFGEYLLNHRIPSDEGHTKVSFATDPELLRNAWLIHFTDEPGSIWQHGFMYGTDDISQLGLTTARSHNSKSKYATWAFAYDVNDFKRYYKSRGTPKYGDQAVVFQATGLKINHYGDEEPQVIFDIKTAHNIITIDSWENEKHGTVWAVMNKESKVPIFQAQDDDWKEFERCVYWIVNNYAQYKNAIDIHKTTQKN